MTDRNRLLQELADCRWFIMRQLADECEDRGEADEAAGWRWLADNQRWPYLDRKKYRLLGYDPRPGYHEFGSRKKSDVYRLPDPVLALMRNRSHASDSFLLSFAAKAVGEWFRTLPAA